VIHVVRIEGRTLCTRKILAQLVLVVAVSFALLSSGCGDGDKTITVYSGRSEELIGPLFERFEDEHGIKVEVRYAKTAQLAALLREEGDRSPADVYIAQDAGALGAVQNAGLLTKLDVEILEQVAPSYRSREGGWVGLSGRVRVVIYNTDAVDSSELPESILDFTDPKWKGRIGWAPTNGSFQAWVTALRISEGEEGARAWLEGVKANAPLEYPKNSAIVAAVGAGEVDVGFVNHYYLYRFLKEEGEGFKARNYYTGSGDIGTLVNVSGAGILVSSDSKEQARKLLNFLLSNDAQSHFAEENAEYPLVAGVPSNIDLPSIAALEPPVLDLSGLEDLGGTIKLLQTVGVLP
jgi:iron(III) transport system substrate-binding protein